MALAKPLPLLEMFVPLLPSMAVVVGPDCPVERLSRLVLPGSLSRMPLMRLCRKPLVTACEASAPDGEGGAGGVGGTAGLHAPETDAAVPPGPVKVRYGLATSAESAT
jgi:hypothetical protein